MIEQVFETGEIRYETCSASEHPFTARRLLRRGESLGHIRTPLGFCNLTGGTYSTPSCDTKLLHISSSNDKHSKSAEYEQITARHSKDDSEYSLPSIGNGYASKSCEVQLYTQAWRWTGTDTQTLAKNSRQGLDSVYTSSTQIRMVVYPSVRGKMDRRRRSLLGWFANGQRIYVHLCSKGIATSRMGK